MSAQSIRPLNAASNIAIHISASMSISPYPLHEEPLGWCPGDLLSNLLSSKQTRDNNNRVTT